MPETAARTRLCEFRNLGRMAYGRAWALQRELVEQRKEGRIPDQFLIVEHPHVITLGRNAKEQNVLAAPEALARAGVEVHATDRGGDVTYHGPGQVVGYPILDLREWKRDVVAYVRGLEQVLVDALADFGLPGERIAGVTGVWVNGRKVAAIGVHVSRWITSHGFALNLDTEMSYFGYIVPCGLSRPVVSMRELGCRASRQEVVRSLLQHLSRVFDCRLVDAAEQVERN